MSCPVCFGGDDPVVRESLNAGIGVLMGVTAIVLACLGRFIVVLKQRARFADQVDFAVTGQRAQPAAENQTGVVNA
jgi:hypothetical protein